MQSSTLEKSPKAEKEKLPPQPWQEITGFTDPEAERKMPRHERRLALRRLFKHYEKMVRDALAEHAADPDKDERTFLWDPLPTICFELGIARRKLSQLTKELTGMAAHDVIDKIRAESITAKLEENIVTLLKGRHTPGKPHAGIGSEWYTEFCDVLRCSKRGLRNDRAHWSIQHGFANYARFRRGCMLAHGGLTPIQLEAKIALDIADYYNCARSLYGRTTLYTMDRWSEAIKAPGTQIMDRWAKARREKPEWLQRMRDTFGLDDFLAPHVDEEIYPPLPPELEQVRLRESK
jgi:hypothetical protein